jgi:hypothetical protein
VKPVGKPNAGNQSAVLQTEPDTRPELGKTTSGSCYGRSVRYPEAVLILQRSIEFFARNLTFLTQVKVLDVGLSQLTRVMGAEHAQAFSRGHNLIGIACGPNGRECG